MKVKLTSTYLKHKLGLQNEEVKLQQEETKPEDLKEKEKQGDTSVTTPPVDKITPS